MGDINALVVFYSRYGTTERLALAAGLGAIQADANIRLRRVADHADTTTIDADANWKKNLDRMNRDYVVPRPADPVWADVIILATPEDRSAEVESYVSSLPSLGSMNGSLHAQRRRSVRTRGIAGNMPRSKGCGQAPWRVAPA